MGPEKQYENKLKALLGSYGAYHIKHFGCAYTQAGVPDILACVNGRFVGIEVKAEGGKPSPLQIKNLQNIDAAGGVAILAYPKDYELIKDLLLAIAKGHSYRHQYNAFKWRFVI